MKILHTSDWHIGHQLYNYDRTPDHREALRAIAAIAAENAVDAILVSGDIFHVANPSAASQKQLSQALAEIRRRCPKARVILAAGNHDGASRLEAYRTLLSDLCIDTVGNAADVENPEAIAADLVTDIGSGYVLTLPYLHPRQLNEGLAEAIDAAIALLPDATKPVVIMAHAPVFGGNFSGHDGDDRVVGGVEIVPAQVFGTVADYIALGHIHCPQDVRGTGGRVRYSGSPLAVGFDEQYGHSVTIVEVSARGAEVVRREIPLPCPRPLVTLGGADGQPLKDITKQLKRVVKLRKKGTDDALKEAAELLAPESFVRVVALLGEDEYLKPDAEAQLRELVCDCGCNFCLLQTRRAQMKKSEGVSTLTVSEFRQMSPRDLAADYASRNGAALTETLLALFAEAAAAADSIDCDDDDFETKTPTPTTD